MLINLVESSSGLPRWAGTWALWVGLDGHSNLDNSVILGGKESNQCQPALRKQRK